MKSKILKKLRSQAGESIGEVLIALLICVISVVMMVGMINASTNVVLKSTNTMQQQYALTHSTAAGNKKKVTLKWDTTQEAEIEVQPYESDGTPVFYAPEL